MLLGVERLKMNDLSQTSQQTGKTSVSGTDNMNAMSVRHTRIHDITLDKKQHTCDIF